MKILIMIVILCSCASSKVGKQTCLGRNILDKAICERYIDIINKDDTFENKTLYLEGLRR